MRRLVTFGVGAVTALATGPAFATVHASDGEDGLSGINHIVVIYEENHSFDNLYGGWEGVNG
jgi:phospholipase C